MVSEWCRPALTGVDCWTGGGCGWCPPRIELPAPVNERVADLLAKMALKEKVAQLYYGMIIIKLY
jgi:hypothetical protein